MPDATLRGKVEDTLRKSSALAQYWQRPVTGAQLQAEVTRMAANTRQPDILREIWSALDNDPYVIAEVLARPLLVERQLQSWFGSDAFPVEFVPTRFDETTLSCAPAEPSIRIPDAEFPETRLPLIVFPLPVTMIPSWFALVSMPS